MRERRNRVKGERRKAKERGRRGRETDGEPYRERKIARDRGLR